MAKTIRHRKNYTYKDKDNFPKFSFGKFFGFRDEPRNIGKYGKKRSYGHFSGLSADYPKHIRKEKINPPPPMNDEE